MIRVQLEFPEEKIAQLEELMSELGVSTKKELINNALTLLLWAVRERKADRLIASVDEVQGKYKELLLPVLENLVRQKAVQEVLAHAPVGVGEVTTSTHNNLQASSRTSR